MSEASSSSKRINGGWGNLKTYTLDCGHEVRTTIGPLRGDTVPCSDCPSGFSTYQIAYPARGNNNGLKPKAPPKSQVAALCRV